METIGNDPASRPSGTKQKVLVETWGCQMNIADTENLMAMLKNENYEMTDNEDDADLMLLNTCHIREKAKQKVLSRLGRLKEHKNKRPWVKIAVAGCVAQAEGKKLIKQAPTIDILFGPGQIDELPRLLKESQEAPKEKHVALGFRQKEEGGGSSVKPYVIPTSSKPLHSGKNPISRFVNIMQGCNNFCTFCVVPHTRGREISRGAADILDECKSLVQGGAKEITLLGQNVNSYGLDLEHADNELPFADLLSKTSMIDGIERVRFTTSNPHDLTKPIADLFFEQPALGRYLHLPLQSGDDTVLERMKRKVTTAQYKKTLSWFYDRDPDFAISTDLIVGFPGETDDQFEGTLAMLEYARFAFVYSFMYSPRSFTPAARFLDQVPDDVKSKRLAKLNEVQNRISQELNLAQIGKSRDVLFLYESLKEPNIYYGRDEHYRLVRCHSIENIVGQRRDLKIIEANRTALVGALESELN